MNQKLNIKNSKLNILITGAAGFIGYHLIQALKQYGHNIVGIDNLNDYYDPQLKRDRLKALGFDTAPIESLKDSAVIASEAKQSMAKGQHLKLKIRPEGSILGVQNLEFINLDLADREGMAGLFSEHQFDVVVNLGAQAGVRYSIDNPHAYVDSNLVEFVNILEGCRHSKVKHLVYASSSSVYGMNTKQPFSTDDRVDFPISLYAATKKSNELMAHTYSHLYGIPTTGLRFFTVYGPMGRPDMAYFKFTKAILEGKTIDVYNNGEMQRDFTYVDAIVEGVIRVMDRIPEVTQGGNCITASSPCEPSEAISQGRHGIKPRDDRSDSVMARDSSVIASEAKQSPANKKMPDQVRHDGHANITAA